VRHYRVVTSGLDSGNVARGLLTFLILAAVLLLVGCGGQAGGSGATPASIPPGAIKVVMKNTAYAPPDVTVKVGQTVAWVNEDSSQHDVVANDGSFKSKLLGPNEVFTFIFSKPGRFPYYCSIHPEMQGVVTVEP
jgi:plastocyanin